MTPTDKRRAVRSALDVVRDTYGEAAVEALTLQGDCGWTAEQIGQWLGISERGAQCLLDRAAALAAEIVRQGYGDSE